jgi:hypothetical protein
MKTIYKKIVEAGDRLAGSKNAAYLRELNAQLTTELELFGVVPLKRKFVAFTGLEASHSSKLGYTLLGIILTLSLVGTLIALIMKSFVVFFVSFASLVLALVGVGVISYVAKNDNVAPKWKAVLFWIVFLSIAMLTIAASIAGSCMFTNVLIMTIGTAIVAGLVMGIGILCFLPGKGILAWFGFLGGVSADSITAPSIFKWVGETTKAGVDSMVNPFLPTNIQVSSDNINLAVGLCVGLLILMSLPAFQEDK